MYAIVKTAGKQYKVKEGDLFQVDHLKGKNEGETFDLNEVLLISDGDDIKIGQEIVEGASVKLTVVKHFRGPKIKIWRSKRRKGYMRRVGYRHSFTELKVEQIIK